MDREEERRAVEKRKYVKMVGAFRDAVKKGSSKSRVYEKNDKVFINWPL